MATKTKGKKKVKKTKPTKRSKAAPKRKGSKALSTRKSSSEGARVARTKKISRRPKKSIRSARPVLRKERPTELESPTSSLGATTTIYESQEVTAFGSPMEEHEENETMTTSKVSPLEESDENLNDSSTLLD